MALHACPGSNKTRTRERSYYYARTTTRVVLREYSCASDHTARPPRIRAAAAAWSPRTPWRHGICDAALPAMARGGRALSVESPDSVETTRRASPAVEDTSVFRSVSRRSRARVLTLRSDFSRRMAARLVRVRAQTRSALPIWSGRSAGGYRFRHPPVPLHRPLCPCLHSG